MSAAATTQRPRSAPCSRRTLKSGAAVTVLLDVISLEASLALALGVRWLLEPVAPIGIGRAQFMGLIVGVLLLPLAYYAVGLYPGYGMNSVRRLRLRTYVTVSIFGCLVVWNQVVGDRQWSRGVLLGTMLFALILPPLVSTAGRALLSKKGLWGAPVVILGGGTTGTLVAKRLTHNAELGLVPIAIFDDDYNKWGRDCDGVPVVGPLNSVPLFRKQCDIAVVAMPSVHRDRLAKVIEHVSFPHVIVVPDLMGVQTMWTTSRDLGGILAVEVRNNLLLRRNRILKRVFDYCISMPLVILALPSVCLFAAIIKLTSPGPALFCQEREGANRKTIRVWKLRTMYMSADALLEQYFVMHPDERANWLRFFKLKRDPRVLPLVGSFLRRTSMDELPQLWNVLRGEMSLVGPRPFPYYHLSSFSDRFRYLRSSVPPGITGLWQVSERSNGDLSVQEAHDTYYIRNWSLWLDLYILGRTVRALIGQKGAY